MAVIAIVGEGLMRERRLARWTMGIPPYREAAAPYAPGGPGYKHLAPPRWSREGATC